VLSADIGIAKEFGGRRNPKEPTTVFYHNLIKPATEQLTQYPECRLNSLTISHCAKRRRKPQRQARKSLKRDRHRTSLFLDGSDVGSLVAHE
jgi:hypothetical protein